MDQSGLRIYQDINEWGFCLANPSPSETVSYQLATMHYPFISHPPLLRPRMVSWAPSPGPYMHLFFFFGLFTCFVPYSRLNACTVTSHVTLDTGESITIFCQLLQVSGCNLVNCSGLHFITYLVGGLPRIWCGIRWPQLCCCWAVYMSSCSALNQGSWLPPLVWRHKQLLY